MFIENSSKFLKWAWVIGVMLIAAVLFSAKPVYAGSGDWGKTVHAGKYYLKFNEKTERVYISRKERSGFRKTPVDGRMFVSNGKQIIYITSDTYVDDYYLKTYDISKKKVRLLKKLIVSDYMDSWDISGLKGQYIWIEYDKWIDSVNDWKHILYRYNIKADSLKKIQSGAHLYHLNDRFYFYSHGKSRNYEFLDYECGSYKSEICTLTSSGKIKTVRQLGYVCELMDHYLYKYSNWGNIKVLYYTKNKSHDLYRIRVNGKGLKKVRSFKATVTDINKKSCLLMSRSGEKKYKF